MFTKTYAPANTELVADAHIAKENGFNYGDMKARQYLAKTQNEVREAAAYARKELGYTSMRERKAAKQTV